MTGTDRKPSAQGVAAAMQSLHDLGLPPTPLLPVEIDGIQCHVKAESLQPVGAFKIRGAWWRLANLSAAEREAGVVAVSSGNHAQGVAWAARRLGIRAIIVMPRDAPRVKLDATRALGAEVVLYDRPGQDRDAVAAEVIAAQGGTLVHAFANSWVIEGQGTAGLEATAQMAPERPSRFIVCCGGGGLTAGLSLACPDAKVIPVEPAGWDMVGQSLASGSIEKVADPKPPTICDALQPDASAPVVLDVLRGRVSSALTVTDAEVREAQRFAMAKLRLVVEPGGAAALAAALAGKAALDERTVIMVTGGNTDPALYAETLARSD